jgi:CRP-like cAMP-binding protein
VSDLAKLDRFARDYPAGSLVFEEGDEASCMYVVQRGEVEIVRRSGIASRLVAIIPAGEFFGEMGLINGRARTATARVRRDARLLELDAATFESMVKSRKEIAIRMIKTMSSRLERANDQVELLLLQDPTHRVVECLRQLAEDYGQVLEDGGAVHIPVSLDELAASVTLSVDQTTDILQKLALARLVVHGSEAGVDGPGYFVPEVAKLFEFLDFLDITERYL